MNWILSAFADEAGMPCDEQIAAARRANLKHVDLRNMDDFNITEMPQDHAREVRKKLDDANLKVNMFGSPIGKIDIADDFEIDLGKLRHLGELSSIFDCNQVRVFSYYNKENRAREAWQEETLRRLTTLREEARNLGLVIFHENEHEIFGDNLPAIQTIARELRDGETFKLIFDFDNYNQCGDDVWQNWEALRDATDSFHLKDSTKDKLHVPIGQGAGRAKEILDDAKNRGWNGSLSIEPHLSHSGAVALTGVGGVENQEFSQMPLSESFHLGVTTAQKLMDEVGVQWT